MKHYRRFIPQLYNQFRLNYIKLTNLNQTKRFYVNEAQKYKNRTLLYYISGVTCLAAAASYAAVPLYRMFCQATGRGGKAELEDNSVRIETMKKVTHRIIKVHFNADTSSSMQWNFKPQQSDIKVMPGETALAFYTATNNSEKPIIGIATYNVVPFEAGQYFNKIQCFCFEEQLLNPHEQVDMPVFFYIDPEYSEDPFLENLNEITLSYTFFEAKEGFKLQIPSFR